jgi:2-keto-4-pentenoate hydratase
MSFPTARLADDPRVRRGMQAQLEQRRRRLDAGERSLGWKVGFGSRAARAQLEIGAPLIGFLTDRSVVPAGASPSLTGWRRPMLEAEIGLSLDSDLPRGPDRHACLTAVGSIVPALELVDVDPSPDDVEQILAGNIFHRHVALGEPSSPVPIGSLRGVVRSPARGVEGVADPQELTGDLVGIIGHVADLLAEFGIDLAAGEIVICGAIVPPIAVNPGDTIRYRLEPLGEIEIELSG